MRAATVACFGASLVLAGAGCLPPDTRPVPGSIHVTAEPSEAVASGFSTDDGWSVSFDRFLVGLGDISLDGPGCNAYSETHYDRLFDFPTGGRQKVGLVYGLGDCELRFRMRSPSSDALFGEGVGAEDVAFMRQEAADPYVEEGRVSLFVQGHAERPGTAKTFTWIFRRSFNLKDCPDEAGTALASDIDIQGGAALERTLVVHGEELFRPAPNEDAPPRFEELAAADLDADGAITQGELAKVEATAWKPDGALEASASGAGTSAPAEDAGPPTLADLVYLALLPRIARIGASAACQAEARDGRGR